MMQRHLRSVEPTAAGGNRVGQDVIGARWSPVFTVIVAIVLLFLIWDMYGALTGSDDDPSITTPVVVQQQQGGQQQPGGIATTLTGGKPGAPSPMQGTSPTP